MRALRESGRAASGTRRGTCAKRLASTTRPATRRSRSSCHAKRAARRCGALHGGGRGQPASGGDLARPSSCPDARRNLLEGKLVPAVDHEAHAARRRWPAGCGAAEEGFWRGGAEGDAAHAAAIRGMSNANFSRVGLFGYWMERNNYASSGKSPRGRAVAHARPHRDGERQGEDPARGGDDGVLPRDGNRQRRVAAERADGPSTGASRTRGLGCTARSRVS